MLSTIAIVPLPTATQWHHLIPLVQKDVLDSTGTIVRHGKISTIKLVVVERILSDVKKQWMNLLGEQGSCS